MTVLSTIQAVAKVIGMDVPTLVYASTDREHVEVAALANTMAVRIMRAHEWELLKTLETLTGDGVTTAFNLPSDYDRMPKKMQLWSSDLENPMQHVTDADRWLEYQVKSPNLVLNAWMKIGGQIQTLDAMASGVTAKYYYQSNKVVLDDDASTTKATFEADGDSFRLDEEMLKLGMIWQWKANKGLPYAEDMVNYEDLLSQRISEDKGSRMLRVGRVRMPRGAQLAYPQTIST